MKKIILALSAALLITGIYVAQNKEANAAVVEDTPAVELKWYNLEEAQKLSDANPRRIFIDFTTSWCGWCKVMDANTFKNPTIAKYMNDNFYCVRFDAETHDTVTFNGQVFTNRGATGTRSAHDFAVAALQGRLSYPSFAFFGKDRKSVTIIRQNNLNRICIITLKTKTKP
jgi:thiol:disulfide interchange protein